MNVSTFNNADIDQNAVPKIPEGIIRDSLGNYEYWFNPRGESGVVVLQGIAARVLSCCDNRSTIGQIRSLTIWSHEEKAVIPEIFWNLAKLQMVNIDPISEFFALERNKSRKKNFTVWIQLTDQCNLRCTYCYIDKSPHEIPLALAKQGLDKILEELDAAGYTELTIKYAGGEPTLRPDAINEITRWASLLELSGIKIHHSLITNGYDLSENMIDIIKKRNLNISISLDGIGAVHDVQRPAIDGSESFSRIDQNITRLLEAGVKPFILTTVTKNNQEHLQELAEYCNDREMGFRLSLYRGKTTEEDEFVSNPDKLSDDLVDFYGWFGDHLPEKSLYLSHRFCDINLLCPKTSNCGIGRSSVAIDAIGNLAVCQFQMEKTIGSLAMGSGILGPLKNQDFYRSDRDNARFVTECSHCKWLYTCANGCPLHINAKYGTFTRESPYCSVYKAVLPALIRAHAKQIIKKGGNPDE